MPGGAYVFTKTASGWKQTAELKGSDTVASDHFGYSVAISGASAVIGAPYHGNDAGRTYVFTKTATGWKQVAELKVAYVGHYAVRRLRLVGRYLGQHRSRGCTR